MNTLSPQNKLTVDTNEFDNINTKHVTQSRTQSVHNKKKKKYLKTDPNATLASRTAERAAKRQKRLQVKERRFLRSIKVEDVENGYVLISLPSKKDIEKRASKSHKHVHETSKNSRKATTKRKSDSVVSKTLKEDLSRSKSLDINDSQRRVKTSKIINKPPKTTKETSLGKTIRQSINFSKRLILFDNISDDTISSEPDIASITLNNNNKNSDVLSEPSMKPKGRNSLIKQRKHVSFQHLDISEISSSNMFESTSESICESVSVSSESKEMEIKSKANQINSEDTESHMIQNLNNGDKRGKVLWIILLVLMIIFIFSLIGAIGLKYFYLEIINIPIDEWKIYLMGKVITVDKLLDSEVINIDKLNCQKTDSIWSNIPFFGTKTECLGIKKNTNNTNESYYNIGNIQFDWMAIIIFIVFLMLTVAVVKLFLCIGDILITKSSNSPKSVVSPRVQDVVSKYWFGDFSD